VANRPAGPAPAAQQSAQRIQANGPAATPAASYPTQPASDTQPIVQPDAANASATNAAVAPATNGGPPPGPAAVQPAIALAIPQQPEWAAKMSIEEQNWINDVLRYWEARSDKVKLFECTFRRWDYDGGFVEQKPDGTATKHPRTFAEGVIKYAQPDKGLYHVEKLVAVMPPAAVGQKPQEIVQNPDLGEHWICDGQRVFSFEASKKQVTETPLPAEMRGKAIADGPLPFMFGAKAETIKARYWIHALVAAPDDESKKNKYWLEAVPQSRQDAQNFKMVRIVLDKQDFLPESLEIFAPNFDPPRNNARQTYVFSNRVAKDEANIKDMVTKGLFGIFLRDFFEPRIPGGWKKVVQQAPDAGPIVPQQAGPAPSQRPTPLPR
jgi:TIGR03009 family protein